MLAPVTAGSRRSDAPTSVRPTAPSDDDQLASLLDASYVDSIDFDPDADHADELRTWRSQDGADDDASFIAVVDGAPVAASLVGRELGAPFLYEVVTSPAHRRRGFAKAVLGSSIAVLAERHADLLAAWVTDGNDSSETLLSALGFVPVTPPLRRDRALGLYRAAQAVRVVTASQTAALAASSDESGPTLWIVEEDRRGVEVDVSGTTVRVEYVSSDDATVAAIAREAVPLRRASWLMSHRS